MEEQQQKPPKPVSLVVGILMIIVALFMDLVLDPLVVLLDFVLIGFLIGFLLDVMNFLLFFAWFWYLGIRGLTSIATQIIGALIELIPGLDLFPGRTLTVIIVIILANSSIGQKINTAMNIKKGAVNLKEKLKKPTPA